METKKRNYHFTTAVASQLQAEVMFYLAITMHTEIQGFEMFDILHFLGFVSYNLIGNRFLSYFDLMFGIWLHCVIFVFINFRQLLSLFNQRLPEQLMDE